MTDEITDKQKAFLLNKGIKVSYGMSKQEASKMIDEIINKPKANGFHKVLVEPELVTFEEAYKNKMPAYNKPKFDTSSYFVAYAKDLCIAMLNAHAAKMSVDATIQPLEIGTIMTQAILCIKQAQKEFQ